MLNNEQFERTRRLALRLAGIELAERHRELLDRKSRRFGIPDGAGLDALLGAAEKGEEQARQKLVRLLTTSFTGFFRHHRHFEVAVAHARRAAHERGAARLWSAAAATGEEPYSLALALIEGFQFENPPVRILASDINEDALAMARRGEYGEKELLTLSWEERARYFSPGANGRWVIAPVVQRLVEFRIVNLAGLQWPLEGPFDVIFCRNVLMYLETSHRYAVLERMASLLAPDGLLIIDPTEHLGRAAHLFGPGNYGVHSRRGALCPRLEASCSPAMRG